MPPRNADEANHGKDRKPRKPSTAPVADNWGGYINMALAEQDKASFASYLADGDVDFWHDLFEFVGEGLKFSLAYDTANECFIATFTGELVRGSKAKYAASARAGSAVEASALLVFKHVVLAKTDWAVWVTAGGTKFNWG